MTSSGTGGLESADPERASLPATRSSSRSQASSPSGGARWRPPWASRFAPSDHEWGDEGRRLDAVADALAEHPVKAVLLTHSETSTGVIQPVEGARSRRERQPASMVVADVVSSLGAVPFEFDAWGVDVAVGGSQKALSASAGDRVRRRSANGRGMPTPQATMPRFYFDWSIYRRFAELPDPENPWTPAISVMQGLQAALELYFQDGVDAAHRRGTSSCRARSRRA